MLWQVEGIAPRFWSAIEQFGLPLNGSEGAKVPLGARNQVVLQDMIQLTYLPPILMNPRRNTQSVSIVVANPFRQFCGQPAKNGVYCSIRIGNPRASGWLVVLGCISNHLLASRGVRCSNLSPYTGGFQKMNVQALFAIVVMTGGTLFATCLRLRPVCLMISHNISLMMSYMTLEIDCLPEWSGQGASVPGLPAGWGSGFPTRTVKRQRLSLNQQSSLDHPRHLPHLYPANADTAGVPHAHASA